MKKVISFCLLICVLFSFVACSGCNKKGEEDNNTVEALNSSLFGSYELLNLGSTKEYLSEDSVITRANDGYYSYFTFYNNGSYYLNWFGYTKEGSYNNDIIKIDNEEITYEFINDNIIEFIYNNEYLQYQKIDDQRVTELQSLARIREDVVEDKVDDNKNKLNDFLFDTELCTMIIDDYQIVNNSLVIAVKIKNNSNKDIIISTNGLSLNGYMCDPFWSQQLTAYESKETNIYIPIDLLIRHGITEFKQLVMNINIFKTNDFSNILFKESFNRDINITVESDNEVENNENEVLLTDDENCKFTILNYTIDSIWGLNLNCYIENKLDNATLYSWTTKNINGAIIDTIWSYYMLSDTKAYLDINIPAYVIEQYKVENIDSIDLIMTLINQEDVVNTKVIQSYELQYVPK